MKKHNCLKTQAKMSLLSPTEASQICEGLRCPRCMEWAEQHEHLMDAANSWPTPSFPEMLESRILQAATAKRSVKLMNRPGRVLVKGGGITAIGFAAVALLILFRPQPAEAFVAQKEYNRMKEQIGTVVTAHMDTYWRSGKFQQGPMNKTDELYFQSCKASASDAQGLATLLSDLNGTHYISATSAPFNWEHKVKNNGEIPENEAQSLALLIGKISQEATRKAPGEARGEATGEVTGPKLARKNQTSKRGHNTTEMRLWREISAKGDGGTRMFVQIGAHTTYIRFSANGNKLEVFKELATQTKNFGFRTLVQDYFAPGAIGTITGHRVSAQNTEVLTAMNKNNQERMVFKVNMTTHLPISAKKQIMEGKKWHTDGILKFAFNSDLPKDIFDPFKMPIGTGI